MGFALFQTLAKPQGHLTRIRFGELVIELSQPAVLDPLSEIRTRTDLGLP